jgi:hypothetical protein
VSPLCLVCQFPGNILYKDSKHRLELLRREHPSLFQSRGFFVTVLHLLDTFTFKLTLRREIVALFSDAAKRKLPTTTTAAAAAPKTTATGGGGSGGGSGGGDETHAPPPPPPAEAEAEAAEETASSSSVASSLLDGGAPATHDASAAAVRALNQ